MRSSKMCDVVELSVEREKRHKISLEDLCWSCGNCGGTQFYLLASGDCECAQCEMISSTMCCFDSTEPPPSAA